MTESIEKRVHMPGDPAIAGLTAKYFCICMDCEGHGFYFYWHERPYNEKSEHEPRCDHCSGDGIVKCAPPGDNDRVIGVIAVQGEAHHWMIPDSDYLPYARRNALDLTRARLPDEYHDPNLDLSFIDAELTRLAIDGDEIEDFPY